jgi:hypothetical protein
MTAFAAAQTFFKFSKLEHQHGDRTATIRIKYSSYQREALELQLQLQLSVYISPTVVPAA